MVKFKVTKQKNRSGDKFWVIFSDKIDDKIIRKLQGFLSMHQIKVITRSKIYHCFDQFLRSLGQCCSSPRSRQNLSNGYVITRQWHQNRHTSGSFLLTLINMFLCQVFNFFQSLECIGLGKKLVKNTARKPKYLLVIWKQSLEKSRTRMSYANCMKTGVILLVFTMN